MTDTPEAVEDLARRLERRGGCDNLHCGDSSPCHDCRGCDMRQAAALIRQQAAELAKVRGDRDAALLAAAENDAWGCQVSEWGQGQEARALSAERERDAAVEVIERIGAPMPGCAWAATERQEIARAFLATLPKGTEHV